MLPLPAPRHLTAVAFVTQRDMFTCQRSHSIWVSQEHSLFIGFCKVLKAPRGSAGFFIWMKSEQVRGALGKGYGVGVRKERLALIKNWVGAGKEPGVRGTWLRRAMSWVYVMKFYLGKQKQKEELPVFLANTSGTQPSPKQVSTPDIPCESLYRGRRGQHWGRYTGPGESSLISQPTVPWPVKSG